MHLIGTIVLVLVLFFLPTGKGIACGAETNCEIGDRHYRIRLPDNPNPEKPFGAIIYAHGYRGSAKGVMSNKSMAKLASELGVALVAAKSYSDDWRIPGVPRNRDTNGNLEFEYFDALIEDLEKRFAIDRRRLIVTGFSAGGMMVWNLACHRSNLFAAFIPMSGTFWEPEPSACSSPPANIVHIHGDNDPVVPLLGRPIADTHQGQVPQVLEMYASYGGYQPDGNQKLGKLDCQTNRNPDSEVLHFCLFRGGHFFRSEYLRAALELLQKSASGKFIPD